MNHTVVSPPTTSAQLKDQSWVGGLTVPLEEQLYQLCGAGEGSVRGEEDLAVVWLLAVPIEEVIHEQVQCGGLKTPHLTGPVLDKRTAWTRLAGLGGGWDGLSAQSDSIHGPILSLLTPLLHRVLGTAEVENSF